MNDNQSNTIFIILVAICAGFFGIVISVITKKIEFRPPARVWIIACIVHFLASLFIFLGVYIFFQSELLPDVMPNDDFSMLVIAYSLSSIPQLTLGMLLLILNKEVIRWLRQRYGKNINFEVNESAQLGVQQIQPQRKPRKRQTKETNEIKEQGELE